MNLTKGLCVADLMTRNTTTVNESDELSTAISTMMTQSLSALPVVDSEGKICGVLSSSDLMSLTYALQCNVSVLPVVTDCVRHALTGALAEDNQDRKVSGVMTTSILTAAPDTPIQQASRSLVNNNIHHLPVIDARFNVVGIISAMDIVNAIAVGGIESV